MPIHNTEMKSFLTTYTPNQINVILHWNQVKFDRSHWNQVNLDHPHKMQVIFHAHSKSNWLSPFDHSPNNEVSFHALTKNKLFSASMQVTSHFPPHTQQPNQFHPDTEIKSSSTITKNKSISMLTLNNFRPAHKNKVNFDPLTKNINFGSHTKTKSIYIPQTKRS